MPIVYSILDMSYVFYKKMVYTAADYSGIYLRWSDYVAYAWLSHQNTKIYIALNN